MGCFFEGHLAIGPLKGLPLKARQFGEFNRDWSGYDVISVLLRSCHCSLE